MRSKNNKHYSDINLPEKRESESFDVEAVKKIKITPEYEEDADFSESGTKFTILNSKIELQSSSDTSIQDLEEDEVYKSGDEGDFPLNFED